MAPDDPARLDRIDDFIERWHGAPVGTLDGPLHHELGWSWDEYRAFVESGTMPVARDGAE